MNKTDSDRNIHFKTVYVVIRAGLVMVHHKDPRPIDANQVPYALIIIQPSLTGSVINSISGMYVYGAGSGDYIQNQIDNLDLLKLLSGDGSTVLEILQHHYLSLSGGTQNEILHPSEPELNGLYDHVTMEQLSSSQQTWNTNSLQGCLSYPGSTDFESFITSFMAGIGSHLALFDILKHQQATIGDPFYPIHIRSPLSNDQAENLLTQGIGKYLGYHARTLQAISRGEKSISRVGPTWLSMIDCFWKGYATCFKIGSLNDPSIAIHDTMIGYCCHQDNKIQILESRFREISTQTNNYLNSIQNQGRTILDQIKMTSETAQKELAQAAAKTMELMTKTCQKFDEQIKILSAKSIQNVQEERQSTISSITALRSDAQKSVHKWADEGVEQIQLVYSQGFEEISSAKAESLTDIRTESQRGLDLIFSEQDRARSNLVNVQREVSKDLAGLHNEGVEKNLLMIEDEKKEFFRFNTIIVNNIQNMADNNVTEIEGLKKQIVKTNKLALDEIDVKVKNARKKLEGMITTSLTNMLDQQNYVVNGIRIDAKKIALEQLNEAMDQAVQETLQRLGVGIDQIVKISIQNKMGFHLDKTKETGDETGALEIIDMSEVNYDHCQILPDYQLNDAAKIISYPQELACSSPFKSTPTLCVGSDVS